MEGNGLYLLLNAASISIPLLLSFDTKVHFYTAWKYVLPAILLVGLPFIAWDVLFTAQGYWGFNERYLSGVYLADLPLAEIFFFITVPYSCLFIYECLRAYFGQRLQTLDLRPVLWLLLTAGIVLNFAHPGKPYTLSATLLAGAIALGLLFARPAYLQLLIATFLLTIIPFLAVNGILTGSWINEEVVWYSPTAFSGWRIFTIPVEDLFYSFDLIALNIIVAEVLRARLGSSDGVPGIKPVSPNQGIPKNG